MGVGVGLPILGLSRTGGSKKSGRMRSVLYEAWEPRAGRDPDIDRSRTPQNIYEGPRSAEAIASAIEARVAEFSDARRKAGGRGIRSNAQFAAAMIIKPEKAWIDGLSEAEKLRFFADAKAVVSDLMNVEPISSVIHVDEEAWHMHLAFLAETPDGAINFDTVFGTKAKKRLNEGFSGAMRQRGGWDIKPADMYDAERAETDPEYKAKRRERRKQQGRSSQAYKRDAVKAEREAVEAAQRRVKVTKEVAELQVEETLRAAQKAEQRVLRAEQEVETLRAELKAALGRCERYMARADEDGPRAEYMRGARSKDGTSMEERFQTRQARLRDQLEKDKALAAKPLQRDLRAEQRAAGRLRGRQGVQLAKAGELYTEEKELENPYAHIFDDI